MLNAEKILADVYCSGSSTYKVLLVHGLQVAQKSIKILDSMLGIVDIDREFIIEASILHDIGISKTHSKLIDCKGTLPYLCHGVEGRKMLDRRGLYKHGLVCERHVGVGLLSTEIIQMRLPLPCRDMMPISFEEKLICYSDKFFSKRLGDKEKDFNTVLADIQRYGRRSSRCFFELHNYFTGKNNFIRNNSRNDS